ncbi:hypothetical protein VN97_g4501 [Penicillium thymicola]|uniref:Uncharacterized protein n=1 Tax=Penicillium thymicola TaxID=293382 RepID=A0AAI9TK76_PENTH|nr:hypothetical protein VN97_g4501 [Penicillium thymicola]
MRDIKDLGIMLSRRYNPFNFVGKPREEAFVLHPQNNLYQQPFISIAVKKKAYMPRPEALTHRLIIHIINDLKVSIVPDIDASFHSTVSLHLDDIASTYASKERQSVSELGLIVCWFG